MSIFKIPFFPAVQKQEHYLAMGEPQNLKHLGGWLDERKDKEGGTYVFLFPH